MIYKKVPKLSNEVMRDVMNYNSKYEVEIEELYNKTLERHPNKTRMSKNWEERKESLMKICKLYYVIKERKNNDPAYNAYKETLEELLFQKGLITIHYGGLPLDQLKTRCIERLVVEAVKELKPNDDIYIPQKEWGVQDKGVDIIWNGKKVDVKTTKHDKEVIFSNDKIGIIKEQSFYDPTKQTDYILYAGNMLEKGYICLIGTEKWEKVKADALSLRGWDTYLYKKFNIQMYAKSLSSLDKQFKNQFIGKIPDELKERVHWATR